MVCELEPSWSFTFANIYMYILNRFVSLWVSRSNLKPPIGKGSKRDSRKRAYTEDDELDPMDPSSYSDAPRGGWYVICLTQLTFFGTSTVCVCACTHVHVCVYIYLYMNCTVTVFWPT